MLAFSQNGFSALHFACQGGHDQVIELLIQAGANMGQETEVKLLLSNLCNKHFVQHWYTHLACHFDLQIDDGNTEQLSY